MFFPLLQIHGAYGLALYVLHYVTKAEPMDIDHELVELYRKAEELEDSVVKSVMAKIAAQVIGRRIQSQQEAALKCLVLKLVYSSRSVVFLDTRFLCSRTRMLRPNNELELLGADDDELFRKGMIDFYYCRPKTAEFELMSAARFFAEYDVKTSKTGFALLGDHGSKKIVKRRRFR